MPKRAGTHKVAVVQHPPVTLNRQKTLQRGVELVEKAAAAGARLVSFPETWVPGYPTDPALVDWSLRDFVRAATTSSPARSTAA